MKKSKFEGKIDINWFDKTSREELIKYLCQICNGVYNNPILLSCGHILCKKCFVNNSSSCLLCQKNRNDNKDKQQDLKIITENPLFITSSLNNIDCICKNRGCHEKLKFLGMVEHILKCPKELIKCEYNCDLEIERDNYKEHLKICENHPCNCPKCGEKNIIFSNLSFHLKNECLSNYINCAFCAKKLLEKEYEVHCEKFCPNSEKICLYQCVGCQDKLQRHNIKQHLNEKSNEHRQMFIKLIEDEKKIIETYKLKNKKLKKENDELFQKIVNIFNKTKKNALGLNEDDNSLSNCSIEVKEMDIQTLNISRNKIINDKIKKNNNNLKKNTKMTKKKRKRISSKIKVNKNEIESFDDDYTYKIH